MKVCNIEGCERKHKARGMCNTHYTRWLKHGEPVSPRPRIRDYGFLLSEAGWLLQFGEWPPDVARRLGVSLDALEIAARRHGKDELAEKLRTGRLAA